MIAGYLHRHKSLHVIGSMIPLIAPVLNAGVKDDTTLGHKRSSLSEMKNVFNGVTPLQIPGIHDSECHNT